MMFEAYPGLSTQKCCIRGIWHPCDMDLETIYSHQGKICRDSIRRTPLYPVDMQGIAPSPFIFKGAHET